MAQVSWDAFRQKRTHNYVTRSPEAYDAGRHIGEEPRGLFGSAWDNLWGGMESMVGGAMDTAGTMLKAQYEEGRASRPAGLIGKFLVDRSIDLNQLAAENTRRSGVLNTYSDMGILDRLTSPSYWLDPRGLTAEVSNMTGSMIPFMLMSAVMPEIGAGTAAGLIGGGLSRFGAKKVAQLFKPGGAGAEFLRDFARWAPTGVVDAASNAGEVAEELRRQGYTDAQIADRIGSAMLYELPYDVVLQGLFGGFLGGKGVRKFTEGSGVLRNIAANAALGGFEALNEAGQEFVQTQAVEQALGNPVGTFMNPTDEERKAFDAAFIGTLPMVVAGGARNVTKNWLRGKAETTQSELQSSAPVKTSGDENVDSLIAQAAEKYGIPVNLLHAIAQTESDYNQGAKSEAGAIGMMQLMPDTAAGLGVDPHDLAGNIDGGAKYLREMLDTFDGDVEKAVAAYNAGPNAVNEHGGIPPFKETQDYVNKVMGGLEGYDVDVPRRMRSLLDDAAPFLGVTMDNGENGCVEAVTKIGAQSCPFLAQELESGVVNVDRLVEHAGDRVIPFDPNQLEEGDVIVYGDESDPQRHVVLYDGKGGYIGNSTEQNKVVQGEDYNAMGAWVPTKIIKTGAQFGGAGARTVAAPVMPDFTGLIADETNIKETQEAIQKLIDTDSLSPAQHAAILDAAQMIRDTPVGDGTDAALEAEHVNEWQDLIDRKDVKGIFEKDPQRVVQTIQQLGKDQRAQKTWAAIENQQQIEAAKQTFQAAAAQQNVQGIPAQVGNTVQQNVPVQGAQQNAQASPTQVEGSVAQIVPDQGMQQSEAVIQPENVMQNAGNQSVNAMQGVPNQPQNVMQNAETAQGVSVQNVQNGVINAPAQEGMPAPQVNVTPAPLETIPTEMEQGVAQRQQTSQTNIAQDEMRGMPEQVRQEEAPLLEIPEYAAARSRGDWGTVAQIAKIARMPRVSQFYHALRERANAAAEPVKAPVPVVGVRPNVPTRLPDNLEERRKLGRALGRFMLANGIPDSPILRDNLAMGRGKAIKAANDRISAWEEKRAEQEARAAQYGDVNARQTAQDSAQNAQNAVDDRILAQHGEHAQNASQTVRGKSAQKQGNKKAADKGGGVVVTGNEFGSYKDLKELRKKALQYYKEHLQGTSVENALLGEINIDDVGLVEFTGSGKRELKNSSAKEEKLLLVKHLPALIRDATDISGKKSSKENHLKEYFYYLHTSAEINGHITPVEITLVKRNNGVIQYYNHTLPTLEKGKKNEGASVSTEPESLNEPSESPSIHAPSSTSTISSEAEESKENNLNDNEREAVKGLSADAKNVYQMIRDKLAETKNKKIARAASVGAALFARHADIIARKVRAALGKPFTAMDYYRTWFDLRYGGEESGFTQAAMKKSDATSLSEFSRQMRTPEAGSGSRKKTFLRITAPSGAFVDVAQDDMIHMHNHHPEMTDEDFSIIQENMEKFLRVHQDKTGKGDYGGETVLCKIKTPRGVAGVSYELLPTGRIFLKTAFFDNENGIDNWIAKNGTSKDLMYADTEKRGNAASMLTGHPSRTADAADSLTPSVAQPLSLFMIQERIGIVNGEKFNQSAWHGTPHDFDGFDLGAIGTGEGTQVHGWGLYFAKERKVSEGYKKRLSTKRTIIHLGENSYVEYGSGYKEISSGERVDGASALGFALDGILASEGDISSVIQTFENDIKESDAENSAFYKEVVRILRENDSSVEEGVDTSRLFEVEIPDDDVLLDEQKSFDEQPKFVQEKIKKLFGEESVEERLIRLEKERGRSPESNRMLAIIRLTKKKIKQLEEEASFIRDTLDRALSDGERKRLFWDLDDLFYVDVSQLDKTSDDELANIEASRPYLEKCLASYEKDIEFKKSMFTPEKMSGGDIYRFWSTVYGSPKAASLALKEVGIKGITYDGRRDGRCYVIFDDKAISIIEKFNQQMNEIIKGTTQDVRDGQRIVSLFEEADESTFLHEMGHLFLLDLERLADMSPMSAEELATVRKWAAWSEGQAEEYKGTPFAAEFAYIDARIRAAIKRGDEKTANKLKRQWEHERFARGFEMYLKHGEAPTKGLRAVFAKFRAFLQRVYQAFTGTGGRATPEVEAVMARMISIEDSSDLSAYPQGKKTAVYTDSGKKIPVQYRVVSADDLIASHDAGALEVNPGYPTALQPRDRERVMMREQVTRMANTLRPEDLADGRNLNQGAPLIRSDGVVLNGNGRTIAIQRAQARNKDRALAYKDYLVENAATFGLSKEDVEGVKNPALVREVQGDISDELMQDIIGSTTGGARMGASEAAHADAEKVTYAMLDTYVPNDKGDLTTAANRSFVAGILHKLVGKDEMNAYLDKDGYPNADGIQRVKRALFALAYGDDELIAKMAESTDDDIRNVSNGLMTAAPMVARLSVKQGAPYVKELQDAISAAVKQLDSLRRSGQSVKDYLGAQALFAEHEDSAEMRAILSFLDENKRSGKRIATYFSSVAKTLDELESPSGNELFDAELPSLMDVLEEAKKYAVSGGQEGLFEDNVQDVAAIKNALTNLARAAWNDKTAQGKVSFAPSRKLRDKVQELFGHDIDEVFITADDMRHIKKHHSEYEEKRGQVSLTPESITDVYDVVNDFDEATLEQSDAAGNQKMMVVKDLDGRTFVLLVERGKSKAEVKTVYKYKKPSPMSDVTSPEPNVRNDSAKVSSTSNISPNEAEGKEKEPTLENILQLAPALKKAALEYGAKDENGKVTFADETRKQEFLKVAKALLGAGERKPSARRQEALQKMLDGIRLIPPTRVSPRKRVIADWGREMGVTVVFFKGDPSLHGFHQDGVTFLNVDSEITPQWTFWHEAMHWMKANNPDIYNELVQTISGAEGFTKEQLDAYRREIGAPEMSDADVIEEMLADALPDVRHRVPLLRDVGKRDTGLVQRVVAWIRDVMRRFHDRFNTPKGGLTNDQRRAMIRAFGNLVGSLRDADGKPIFRIENEGARITLRGGKPLPAVKYSLDNRGKEGDNEGGRNLGEARKEAICSNVIARMKMRVREMLKQGIPFAEIQKELEDENSTSREEALRVFKTQWNIFNSPRVNKRNIVERITKREDFTDDEVNELFEQYKSTMKEMLDYGGFIYKEAAFQQRGNREFLAGVHSWRELERANARHGGSAHTGQKNSLNTKHLEQQGAFSTPTSKESMRWIAEHPFKYDESRTMDENIQRAESLAQEYLDTFGTTDQINTPARQELRREIADKLYGKGAAKKEGKVWLVLGVPASGKSTISDPIMEREGALLIDSDEAKKLLPEFSNGLLAGAVHEESSDIATNVMERAIANHDNIVWPLVGKTRTSIDEKVQKFKEAGYEVNLVYVDLPIEKAIERTKARFRHTGRLVPPRYLQSVGLKPKQNYDKIKTEEGVDSYEAWNNDVARGELPVRTEYGSIHAEKTRKNQPTTRGMGRRGYTSVYRGQDVGAYRRETQTNTDDTVNNTTNRSDHRGGFSTPKFSANTSGESPKGNFKLLKDRIRSLVGVAPLDNLELPGRVRRTVILSPAKLEQRVKGGWIQKKNIISEEKQKDGKIAVTYYPDTRDVGYADYVKSVRQVAKRNPFVKVLYDLAHKAMKKQEKLRNEFGKALKEFNDLVKNEKDLKSITAILWQGDAEGRVFSDAELRSLGANERVIKAYRLVRRELEKAYKLLRDAQTQVKTRSQTLDPESVETFKKNHWIEDADVISETLRADGTVLLTWRGGKTYDVKSKTMTAAELKLMQEDENVNVTSAMPIQAALDDFRAHAGRGLYQVNYVERIKPVFRRTGYMPHFFHEWMIYEKIKDPTTGKERYVSVGSGRTMNEAVKIGNEIAKDNADKQYVLRPKGFDLGAENAVVIGDMDFAQMSQKLAESTEISLADARSLLLEDAGASLKSRHRFFGSLLERKDGKGFDQDVQWVLAHYFNSAARYIAMEDFKPTAISMYERFFGRFDDEPRSLTAQYCKNLINDVNGNPRGVEVWLNDLLKKTWIGKHIADSYGDRVALAVNGELSTWNAITKLGLFNFASMAVNFSQFINVGAALNDYGYAAKGLKRALNPSALDEKIIEASGLLDDINMLADNGGYTQRRGGKVRGIYSALKKGGEWTLIPFQKADMLMRKAAVLGAYYQGVEQKGMKTAPGDELSAEALAYAQDINDDANFDYSSANAPGMFRAGSVVTQQLFQFQKYPIMQFEFMYNILKNGTRGQKVRFFVPYVLFCGMCGSLPFGGLFNQLFSFLFGLATGDDEDIAQEVKAEVLRWAGKDPVKKAIAETALYGILAPTFGLDISGRIGMSNAFGGEFYGAQKPESVAGVIGQQLGGPAANSIYNMFHQFHEGNNIEALKAVSPALGNMFQATVGVSRTTRHRVNARYDTAYDKIAHALGFRSVEESKNAFIMNYEYEQKAKQNHTKQEAIQDYLDDPSDANRRTINALGITERQIKEARIQQERTALERAREGRPNTSRKHGTSQRRKEETKKETLYDTLDDE
jgi:predicted ABC-type ATPase